MLPPEQDLPRRRPVWEALADLFVDNELDDTDYRSIAQRIVASGYAPADVHAILWNEVFPTVEFNLRCPAGECWFFDADWLQERILTPRHRGLQWLKRVLPVGDTASIIRKEWATLLRFLPAEFSRR